MVKDKCECGDGCCGKPVIAIGVILAAILLAVAFSAGMMLSKDSKIIVSNDGTNPDLKTLNVSGSVTKNVSPDKVDIVLSVETLDKSAQKSQSDNAVIADKVRAALSAAGVASTDIKTVSYSENEDFEYNDVTKKSDSIGFRTINSIQVTLKDVTKAGFVVDAAVGAGANRVSSIAFGLTDAKELEVRKAALQQASNVAKVKADSIAAGLGVAVGKVHSISESSFYYAPNYANYDTSLAGNAVAKTVTPITSGDIAVDASVSVEFEIN